MTLLIKVNKKQICNVSFINVTSEDVVCKVFISIVKVFIITIVKSCADLVLGVKVNLWTSLFQKVVIKKVIRQLG